MILPNILVQILSYSCKLKERLQANGIRPLVYGLSQISNSIPGVSEIITVVAILMPCQEIDIKEKIYFKNNIWRCMYDENN